jgi:hypothetical protein
MFKKGVFVIIKEPFYHCGENLGGRIGLVKSDEGILIVSVANYNNNPVKCFRNEVKLLTEDDKTILENEQLEDLSLDDINDMLDDWFNKDTDSIKIP